MGLPARRTAANIALLIHIALLIAFCTQVPTSDDMSHIQKTVLRCCVALLNACHVQCWVQHITKGLALHSYTNFKCFLCGVNLFILFVLI